MEDIIEDLLQVRDEAVQQGLSKREKRKVMNKTIDELLKEKIEYLKKKSYINKSGKTINKSKEQIKRDTQILETLQEIEKLIKKKEKEFKRIEKDSGMRKIRKLRKKINNEKNKKLLAGLQKDLNKTIASVPLDTRSILKDIENIIKELQKDLEFILKNDFDELDRSIQKKLLKLNKENRDLIWIEKNQPEQKELIEQKRNEIQELDNLITLLRDLQFEVELGTQDLKIIQNTFDLIDELYNARVSLAKKQDLKLKKKLTAQQKDILRNRIQELELQLEKSIPDFGVENIQNLIDLKKILNNKGIEKIGKKFNIKKRLEIIQKEISKLSGDKPDLQKVNKLEKEMIDLLNLINKSDELKEYKRQFRGKRVQYIKGPLKGKKGIVQEVTLSGISVLRDDEDRVDLVLNPEILEVTGRIRSKNPVVEEELSDDQLEEIQKDLQKKIIKASKVITKSADISELQTPEQNKVIRDANRIVVDIYRNEGKINIDDKNILYALVAAIIQLLRGDTDNKLAKKLKKNGTIQTITVGDTVVKPIAHVKTFIKLLKRDIGAEFQPKPRRRRVMINNKESEERKRYPVRTFLKLPKPKPFPKIGNQQEKQEEREELSDYRLRDLFEDKYVPEDLGDDLFPKPRRTEEEERRAQLDMEKENRRLKKRRQKKKDP